MFVDMTTLYHMQSMNMIAALGLLFLDEETAFW